MESIPYKEFNRSLEELWLNLEKTRSYINFDDYPKNNYTPEQIKMMNNTFGLI